MPTKFRMQISQEAMLIRRIYQQYLNGPAQEEQLLTTTDEICKVVESSSSPEYLCSLVTLEEKEVLDRKDMKTLNDICKKAKYLARHKIKTLCLPFLSLFSADVVSELMEYAILL